MRRHLKPVVCVCYRAPCSRADRLTASSHNIPLTLCSASRSTRRDQRKEAGEAFGVFSAFPSPTIHHRWHLWLGSFLTVLSNVFFLRIFTHRNLILVFDIWTSILLTQRHAFLVSTSLLLFTQETNPWWCRHLRIACRAVGHWCGIGSSAIWSQTGTVTSDLCYCLLINMGQNAQMPGLNVSLLLI